tara:strand:- start:1262 stop:1420 length:159 start_codon:yes stop_codon:yes gene_type:complete
MRIGVLIIEVGGLPALAVVYIVGRFSMAYEQELHALHVELKPAYTEFAHIPT